MKREEMLVLQRRLQELLAEGKRDGDDPMSADFAAFKLDVKRNEVMRAAREHPSLKWCETHGGMMVWI